MQFRSADSHCRRCRKPLEIAEPEPAIPTLVPTGKIGDSSSDLDVARAVRDLRRTRMLSQRQLAGRMQVPRTYISKIENGKAMPTLSSLERLATALNAPLSALVEDRRSRRAQMIQEIVDDPFLAEILPLVAKLNSFHKQVVLSHARNMARETATGRLVLSRA